jgi:hypothetical protein
MTSRSSTASFASSGYAPEEQEQQQGFISMAFEDEDNWGQFVDTAEADAEIIRYSKILSRRNSK